MNFAGFSTIVNAGAKCGSSVRAELFSPPRPVSVLVCPWLSPDLVDYSVLPSYKRASGTAHDTQRPRASAEMSDRDDPTKLAVPAGLPTVELPLQFAISD